MTHAIVTPTADQERPRAIVAIAVAVLCFGLGLTAVVATSDPAPTDVGRTHTPAQRTAPLTPTAAAPKRLSSETPPSPSVVVAPPADPTGTTADDAAEDAPVLIPGRVAYLRCDGLSAEPGRFPCPRDARLEDAVWQALAALTSCKPSLGRGTIDVRLDISRGQRTEARVVGIADSPEPALGSDAVYACVGKRLTNLTTTLDPLYMVVSFRVALR